MYRRQKMLGLVISVVITFQVFAGVTALGWESNTPLYTLRMEQQSSKLNFLPTEMNEFTYVAQAGYSLDYNADGSCGCLGARYVVPRWPYTCNTCDEYYCEEPTHCGTCATCWGMPTCSPVSCPWTEWPFCEVTQVWPTCDWLTVCAWC